MELKIEQYELKPIGFNFEELKEQLEQQLEKYQNLVFTDETMNEAKKTRTDLNNLINTIETERKRIKKEWNQPYVEFKTKIKELVSLVEQPKLEIDTQIKNFEDKKKQEKLQEITNYFNEINECQYLKFEMIFDEKWLNASASMKNVKDTISSKVGAFSAGVSAIERQEPKYQVQMLDKYIQTLDLSSALLEKERLEKLEFEATKNLIAEDMQSAKEEQNAPSQELTSNDAPKEGDLEILDFRVYVTKEQKALLREFLITNGIKYGRVE